MKNGYAVVENPSEEILLSMNMPVRTVYAHPAVLRDAGCVAITRGPIVYCAEAVDNVELLHRVILTPGASAVEIPDPTTGLVRLELPALYERASADAPLYSYAPPEKEPITLRLLPYSAFANRGETNMRVWFRTE